MTQNRAGVWLFGVATLLAFVAALLPLLKGERLNVTFMSVGVVFLVLTAAAAKKDRSSGNPPPAA
jgi:succinate-acetate transporter protein